MSHSEYEALWNHNELVSFLRPRMGSESPWAYYVTMLSNLAVMHSRVETIPDGVEALPRIRTGGGDKACYTVIMSGMRPLIIKLAFLSASRSTA